MFNGQREFELCANVIPKKLTLECKGDIIHGKIVYRSVVLTLVDIEQNKNSYHRMELLQSKDPRSTFL